MFFRELADLAAIGGPQLPEIADLAERYGRQFGQPEWLPDLISRYGLSPQTLALHMPGQPRAGNAAMA